MAPITKRIEVVRATEAAVQAARTSRAAVSAFVQGRAAKGYRGTVTLEEVVLPVGVVQALVRILDELSEGRDVAIHAVADPAAAEVTTSEAAALLGMSRPTLIAVLQKGGLPYRMVGTHRRLVVADVLAFRRSARRGAEAEPSREKMLEGLEEMAEYTDRLGLGY